MKKQFAIIAAAALIFTACSGSESSVEKTAEETMTAPLSALLSESEKYNSELLSQKLDNISVPDDLNVVFPRELGVYKIKIASDFNDKKESLYTALIPDDILKSGEVTLNEKSTPYGPTFYDPASRTRLDIGENGFLSFTQNNSSADDEENEPAYKLSVVDTYDESESVKAVRGFADKLADAAGYDSGLKPFYKLEYENNETKIVLQPTFKDTPLESLGIEFAGSEGLGNTFDDSFFTMNYWGKVSSSGVVSEFVVQGEFNEFETEESYESIITPGSAVRLMSEKLSPALELEIEGMELVYMPHYVENKSTLKRVTDEVKAGIRNMYLPDNIIRLVPYWAIYFDLTPSQERYGLVDAKTGEAFYISNE